MQEAEKTLVSLDRLCGHYPAEIDHKTQNLLCSMGCEKSQLLVGSKIDNHFDSINRRNFTK